MDKIGRYVSDVGRRDARLAFPPICDLSFLFQVTRGKPADCRGDSHIGLFCPEKQKSGKNASSRFSRAGEPRSGRKPPRIRRTSSSRQAETEKERHLLRELVPRRGVLPQEPREAKLATRRGVRHRSHKKQSLISTKASAAGATGSEALRETRNSGNPQPGSPLPAEFARPQKLPCEPQPCRDLRGIPQNEDDED